MARVNACTRRARTALRPVFGGMWTALGMAHGQGGMTRSGGSLVHRCPVRWLAAGCWLAASFTVPGKSPFAEAAPLPPGEVVWTEGFWAEHFERCRSRMIPDMQKLMEGTDVSHYLRNFQIAAGVAEGRYRGAPFNDGDFYKWMEGAIATLAAEPDPALQDRLDEIVEIIVLAQRPDGYLHTPVLAKRRNGDLRVAPFQDRHNFEMYNMGHLFTTAVLHHQVTGQTNLLSVARKAADFLHATIMGGASPEAARSSVCPSHYMGLIDLFRETGDTRYLELVQRLLEQRSEVADGGDDNQDRIPFERQRQAVGHAVRANYLYAGAADLYLETGDGRWWQPLDPIWHNLIERKIYITGGCGALYDGASPFASKNQRTITRTHQAYGHDYELPNTTAHNETCASIGSVLWNWRMFLATGEARFVDVLETALYNSVLSGVSLDGTRFFYTNPLRVTDPLPIDLRWSRQRVPYVSAFCCPPNVVRVLAASSRYAYAKTDDTLWVNLYGRSAVTTKLAGRPVRLHQETDYPWGGQVRITVEDGGTFTLRLRIPAWARDPVVHLNRLPVGSARPGTYLEVRRTWTAGDMVHLKFNMPVRRMEAHPLVEELVGQHAFQRGPLVYCLESTDLPEGVKVTDIAVPADAAFQARFDPDLLGGTVSLEGTLAVRPRADWSGRLYREFQAASYRSVETRLVPYYAWANRGPGEMTVWMPTLPSMPGRGAGQPRRSGLSTGATEGD